MGEYGIKFKFKLRKSFYIIEFLALTTLKLISILIHFRFKIKIVFQNVIKVAYTKPLKYRMCDVFLIIFVG